MNDAASFDDSDEIFDLYSTKAITQTFKSQLRQIISDNRDVLLNGGTVENKSDSEEKPDEDCRTQKPSRSRKKTVRGCSASKPKKSKVVSVEDSPPVVVLDECSLEDSIEVLEEDISRLEPRRRSGRLRRKRTTVSYEDGDENQSNLDIDSEVTRTIRAKQTKKGRKQKKQPKIDEVIVLDDSLSKSPPPDVLEDEINPEVSVKVIWKSVIVKKFQIRKFQKLSKIYELLSKEENVPENRISLTFNDDEINPNDTPDSLNLQIYHFLEGRVLNERTNSYQTSNPQTSSTKSENSISLKFQNEHKKIVNVTIEKDEKIKVAMIKYSEQVEVPLSNIKFFFDGELLQPSETPESLGLEGGEIIDIKIKN